jgi:hypothetical protein
MGLSLNPGPQIPTEWFLAGILLLLLMGLVVALAL